MYPRTRHKVSKKFHQKSRGLCQKCLRSLFAYPSPCDYKFFEKTMHILKLRPVLTSKIKSIKEWGQVLKKHSYLPLGILNTVLLLFYREQYRYAVAVPSEISKTIAQAYSIWS